MSVLIDGLKTVVSTIHASITSLFSSVAVINSDLAQEVDLLDADAVTELANAEGVSGSTNLSNYQALVTRLDALETATSELEEATTYASAANYQELPGGFYRVWGVTDAVTITHGSYGGPTTTSTLNITLPFAVSEVIEFSDFNAAPTTGSNDIICKSSCTLASDGLTFRLFTFKLYTGTQGYAYKVAIHWSMVVRKAS